MLALLTSAADATQWLRERVRGDLAIDSRRVAAGDGFIAWPGHAVDARAFVPAALAAGAAACLVEAEGHRGFPLEDPRVAALPALKVATGAIADLWYGAPSAALEVVAVTGTNGKTSSTCWLAQALTASGRRCGVIGTLGIGEPGALEPGALTTPDPLRLHGGLRRFADAGFAACAIEASSIGLAEHRLAALRIAVAVFTNFTRDHLDFHGSMQAYWAAKRALFDWPGLRAAVVNVDDAQGAGLADELASRHDLDLWTVALHGPARLQGRALHYVDGGLAFEVVEGASTVTVQTPLVGDYNASNLLGVLGALRALGVPLAEAATALAVVTAVPGRMQRLPGREVDIVIDYAHTPDALEKVLQALRPLAAARGGRLWCVFGCGGNRDATKRPLMGAIAKRDADRVVLTSDNPRDEPACLILAQILAGVTGHGDVDVIEDRRAAIRSAVRGAAPGDVVLLAGKGHEDYQEIAGVRRPFSDAVEAAAALAEREGAAAAC